MTVAAETFRQERREEREKGGVEIIQMVKILGIDYEVKESPCINRDEYKLGSIDHVAAVILIDANLSEKRKQQTLLHEILHATFHLLGMHEEHSNEQLVSSLSAVLFQVITENKSLFVGLCLGQSTRSD